ncbi:MAG: hypothetical protein F6J86_06310 [Symploca sp. SIO1B1]|nr:hypothetical protein [Symploca sp. SIO1B1]
MPSKSEKLTQRIQEIQDFLAVSSRHNLEVAGIAQELENISASLKIGKPVIHIASQNPILGQALHQALIYTSKKLLDSYQFQVTTLASDSESALPVISELLDCDVFCLLVEDNQPLGEHLKYLIDQAENAAIEKQFIIVDISESDCQSPSAIKTKITETTTWIKSQFTAHNFAVFPLFLQPFATNTQETEIDGNNLKEIEQFCKSLETVVRRKPEEVVAKRLTAKVLGQLDQLEAAINHQEDALKKEIGEANGQLDRIKQSNSTDELKQKLEQVIEQVQQDKDNFFKQVELDLKQSIGQLMDGFYRNSIVHRIVAFTHSLQPCVIRHKGAQYIRLQSEDSQTSADINIDMMHLCYSHLTQWSIEEWRRIYTYYGEGGISQLFHRTYAALDFIPSSELRLPSFQPNQDYVPFRHGLKNLVAGVQCESYYKDIFVLNYILKQVRSQWMGITFLLTFGTMLGLVEKNKRDFIRDLFQQPFEALQAQPLWLGTMLLAIPICGLFLLLFYNYHNNSQRKLNDVADKLKKTLTDYYQRFTKVSVDKITQDFIAALESEDTRLKKLIERVRQDTVAYIAEAEKSQIVIKSELAQLTDRQKELAQTKVSLKKLQRL